MIAGQQGIAKGERIEAITQQPILVPIHMSADQILARVRESVPATSRATVYNTLKLLREKGMLRELIVDP